MKLTIISAARPNFMKIAPICRAADAAREAGNKYGFVWSPDVGQEVLLVFPYGDINQPIILGSMYSEKNKPPQELKKDNQDIYYKSKEGNEFTIHDEKNKSKIEITTQKGHKLIYDDDKETLTIQSKG